jgi:hypothetical protein
MTSKILNCEDICGSGKKLHIFLASVLDGDQLHALSSRSQGIETSVTIRCGCCYYYYVSFSERTFKILKRQKKLHFVYHFRNGLSNNGIDIPHKYTALPAVATRGLHKYHQYKFKLVL